MSKKDVSSELETSMPLPESVNILGIVYTSEYVAKPYEVDIFKRDSLSGQLDYWTRTIRIFDDGKRQHADTWQTIMHEVLHGLANALDLDSLDQNDEEKHKELDRLALGLVDVLMRNNWGLK